MRGCSFYVSQHQNRKTKALIQSCICSFLPFTERAEYEFMAKVNFVQSVDVDDDDTKRNQVKKIKRTKLRFL